MDKKSLKIIGIAIFLLLFIITAYSRVSNMSYTAMGSGTETGGDNTNCVTEEFTDYASRVKSSSTRVCRNCFFEASPDTLYNLDGSVRGLKFKGIGGPDFNVTVISMCEDTPDMNSTCGEQVYSGYPSCPDKEVLYGDDTGTGTGTDTGNSGVNLLFN